MKIYLASPFFNDEELADVIRAENILLARGFDIFSPRLHEVRTDKIADPARWSRETFEMDRVNIDRCDCVVMLYRGAYSDSGTAWECGYAFGTGKPVVVVQLGEDSNLMVHEGSRASISRFCHNSVTFRRYGLYMEGYRLEGR